MNLHKGGGKMSGNTIRRRMGFALVCLLSASQPLVSEERDPRYDLVNLSAQASSEVENDTLIAVLYAQKEGDDLAPLTGSVNRLVAQGIDEAKRSKGVKVQTLDYLTSPIYQQQRLSGWRVRQSIRLESLQSDKLSELLSKLQSSLALESVSYAISPARRRQVEDSLTQQAIDAFRRRAELITHQLGRSQYRLVEMTVQTSGQPVQPLRMRASMMAMERASAAPTLEAGSRTVQVGITGSIELQVH
ncbi:MAG: SIMPL domain-containing protein [Candidatus Thiodiazotropha sp. (ex Epidulcina cf. delphinae)]|nr:SIMPL domain-containing protein [Candidatus Thiodiazotropha sp. (ex Epidulcina cf. delphinae)]